MDLEAEGDAGAAQHREEDDRRPGKLGVGGAKQER